MRTMVQSFSIGIITATLIIGIIYMMGNGETSEANSNMTKEQAEEFLNEEGFAVVHSTQYEEVVNEKQRLETELEQLNKELTELQDQEKTHEEAEDNNETNETDNEPNHNETTDQEESNQTNESETVSFTLIIESGMTSIDISNVLEREQIIDQADKFNDFLEQNNYSRQIQLGEYQLNDKMSFEDIAEVITN